MRLSEAIPQFERQLAANGRFTHTRKTCLRDLRALSRWMGKNPNVDSSTPDTLARFLMSDTVLCTPAGEPRAAISVNRTKSALRSFFAFCLESGFLKENPARLIWSSPARAKEPSTLEAEEIELIRAVLAEKTGSLAERDHLIFELLLGTGIRMGSLVALNRGAHDPVLGPGVVRVWQPVRVLVNVQSARNRTGRGQCHPGLEHNRTFSHRTRAKRQGLVPESGPVRNDAYRRRVDLCLCLCPCAGHPRAGGKDAGGLH